MKTIIDEMIDSYKPKTIDEAKMIIREIVQSIVLIGLSRAGFFSKASFYGGTALRIFYNLNRYSEDLDFTLNYPDPTFSIDDYIEKIRETASSYDFDLEATTKTKSIDAPIESAFAKPNTYQTFINFKLDKSLSNTLHKDEILKVKFEIDCNPPLGFKVENKWIDMPEFASVSLLDEGSLFSGKIHAVLCRNYKNTVKGRDYYDFLFYMKRKVKPNVEYLKNKLIDSGKINETDDFNLKILSEMLIKKFEVVDFEQVKKDVSRFVLKGEDLSYCTKDLFIQMAKKISEIKD